jgi:hypothetical protein
MAFSNEHTNNPRAKAIRRFNRLVEKNKRLNEVVEAAKAKRARRDAKRAKNIYTMRNYPL